MNKRSKSQKIVVKSHPLTLNQSKINKTILTLNQNNSLLAQQLSDLQFKVQESKPILESIYDKIKKKQAKYQQQLKQQNSKIEIAHKITKEYKLLHEQSLKIIKKNHIIDKCEGINHYRSLSTHQLAPLQKIEDGLVRNKYQQYQSVRNLNADHKRPLDNYQSIVDQYKIKKKESQGQYLVREISAKNIYQRFRTKIQQGKENNQSQSNLIKVRNLSKEIDKDIEQLRLSKGKSTQHLKIKAEIQQLQTKPKKGKKEYFLQLQKRKLKNI